MKDLKLFTLIGIFFVFVTGTVWHFVYKWSGNHFLAGLFFPVNESTWEHMKLCFFPMLIYSVYMNKKLKKQYPDITSALLCGILSGTLSIPAVFYTYSGVLGYNVMLLDILTFLVSVLFAFFIAYKLSLSCKAVPYQSLLKFVVLVFIACFFLFTYFPPALGIFTNPSS